MDRFIPAWWCPGAHSQTVYRTLLGKTPSLPVKRVRWKTPDGDFLDLDFLEAPEKADKYTPLILLLHGLEGSSRAKYMLGLLEACFKNQWPAVALNFRSCSGELNLRPQSYHFGETKDLSFVIKNLISLHPGRLIGIAGFSLGGNVLLKWLGENSSQTPGEIFAAAAVSVPFDLAVSSARIDRLVFNRIVYGRRFLKTLKSKSLRKIRDFKLDIPERRIRKINTLGEFDNLITAPLHGFRDGEDYYEQSSSVHFLDKIRKAVYLLNAADDPFFPAENIPTGKIRRNEFLEAEYTVTGGHAGFVSGDFPWKAAYLPEERIIEFFKRKLAAIDR
ncbi:MAG TPA: alpha/beta fold hydrolase [Nitrospiria bacterium]|nr:alpha/beta fold hydrolase [Nitrospiria bacterium]